MIPSLSCSALMHRRVALVLLPLVCGLISQPVFGQTTPKEEEEKSKKELRQERREERREAREERRAERDSSKAAEGDKPGLFARLFGGEDAARNAIDSTTAENEELRGYAAGYEESIRNGDVAKARAFLEKYQRVRDSLAFARLEIQAAQYDAEMARHDAEVLARENEIKTKQAAIATQEAKISQTINYGLGGAILLVGAFVVVLVRSIRQKRKANALLNDKNAQLADSNAALSQAYEEIQTQQEALERQHENIMESIKYARRIQEAILPEQDPIQGTLDDYFIFYKPKDIVSGDFYWFHVSDGKTYIAAVDCTGHGVPGAFMSVLGISLLNQIVRDHPEATAGQLLDHLHKGVQHSLHQLGGEKGTMGQQDGMDLGLAILSKDKRSLQFAGANNPLYLIRNGELEELKGDRAPIGGSTYAAHAFSSYDIKVAPGDRFYLFSDGFADQFGGEKGRKFTYKRLRQWAMRQNGEAMAAQRASLSDEFDAWRGNREQLDDVLVIGVRLA